MQESHQKHPPLARPRQGHYARTEYALVGTTCARMEAIMRRWRERLDEHYRCLEVSGEHQDHSVAHSLRCERKTFAGAATSWNDYDNRLLGSGYDLVLVNGNHYPAARQIVFIDSQKAGTLERRREQLTSVAAIVFCEEKLEMPAWLRSHLGSEVMNVPQIQLSEVDHLLPAIEKACAANVPVLRALILTGGRSQRMQADKSKLVYRAGQTETERLAEICSDLGLSVALSVREPDDLLPDSYTQIADRFLGLGPLGAICSAFLADPDSAWLVLACDLPLLDAATLETLVTRRRSNRYATAVRGPEREWPEPLIAIYEPRAYQRMLRLLSLGYACPRKLLINSDTEVVELSDDSPIINVNTPEERARILQLLAT